MYSFISFSGLQMIVWDIKCLEICMIFMIQNNCVSCCESSWQHTSCQELENTFEIKKYHISHGRTWQTNYYKQVALYLCNKQEQQKGSRKRKNAKGRRRKEEDKGRRRKKCKPMALTRCRDVKVLCLVDIGASRSGVKGRDEGRELALQHKLVVPRPSLSGLSNHLLILLERKHIHISFPLSDMLLYVHH